jgi:hypothetical protein
MKKYQMYSRVFISDSVGRHTATVIDILNSADNSGYIYFIKYDKDYSTEWVSESDITPIEYQIGERVVSQYGRGYVDNVVNGIYQIVYKHGMLYQLECELQPDNTPKKKSLLKRIVNKVV